MRLRGWIVLLTTLIAMVLSADGCALLLVESGARSDAAAPPGGAGARGAGGERHLAAAAAALRSMMRAVVTDGTAAHAGLPPGVSGKTGTAEYGTSGDSAHAWFIGFTGDLAFAAFVQGGGWGAEAAAPLAAAFLRGGR
jgi:hypothetical protein